MENIEWRTVSKKSLLKTPVLDVTEHGCESENGKARGDYVVIDARDWAVVVPLLKTADGEKFVMVEQWRHGIKSKSIEFPGGVIDDGEAPETGAKRELLEETGYKAGKIVHLASFSPNPALFSNHVHIFAAFDLENTGKTGFDADEFISIRLEKPHDVYANLAGTEYQHALMLCAAFLFQREFDQNKN